MSRLGAGPCISLSIALSGVKGVTTGASDASPAKRPSPIDQAQLRREEEK